MDLVDSLFTIARKVTDGDIDEVNNLRIKARNEVDTYGTESGGVKGMYAKLHKGWIFQLVLIFATPLLTAYFHNLKQSILNKSENNFDDDDGDELESILER